MAVLQLSIILYYDTLKILKSGLDRGPIIAVVSFHSFMRKRLGRNMIRQMKLSTKDLRELEMKIKQSGWLN